MCSGVTSENRVTFFLLVLFVVVPKDRFIKQSDKGQKKKNTYISKVIKHVTYFITKSSPVRLILWVFQLRNNSVFLIWCQENLVTANTMFSKADLASEGGKLSRASSALFPW